MGKGRMVLLMGSSVSRNENAIPRKSLDQSLSVTCDLASLYMIGCQTCFHCIVEVPSCVEGLEQRLGNRVGDKAHPTQQIDE